MGFLSILLIDIFSIWLVVKGISRLVHKVRDLDPKSKNNISEEEK